MTQITRHALPRPHLLVPSNSDSKLRQFFCGVFKSVEYWRDGGGFTVHWPSTAVDTCRISGGLDITIVNMVLVVVHELSRQYWCDRLACDEWYS